MKTQGRLPSFPAMVERFQQGMARISALTFPRRLVPVPVPTRRRLATGSPRRTPPHRLAGWLPLMVGLVLLTAIPAWAGQPNLPAGVPNIYDSEVRAHYEPIGVANLRGNPDFPVILVANTTGDQPQGLLLGLDARNGKATWSLTRDPIILIVVLSGEATIQGVYVDIGFANQAKASGTYAAVDAANSPALFGLLKAVTEAVTRTYI